MFIEYQEMTKGATYFPNRSFHIYIKLVIKITQARGPPGRLQSSKTILTHDVAITYTKMTACPVHFIIQQRFP